MPEDDGLPPPKDQKPEASTTQPTASTSNPLFGAPPPPSSTDPTPFPTDEQPSPSGQEATSNPLFGAAPSSDPSPEQGEARFRFEDSSRDRVRDLKSARDAALAGSSTLTRRSPPFSSSTQTLAPPIPARPLRPLPLALRPSPIPSFLIRLTRLLSLFVFSSSAIALVFSTFLLPLLQATFSARKVLVEQQLERVRGLVERLRAMRASRLYGAGEAPTQDTRGDDPSKEKLNEIHEGSAEGEKELLVASVSSLHSSPPTPPPPPPTTKTLIPSLAPLIAPLTSLAATLASTSTTRLSLLSTLESYTAQLHRDIYLRPSTSSSSSRNGYSLGTLGANLSKASGGRESGWAVRGLEGERNATTGEGGLEGVGVRADEWDSVRKEVRAIKGMLLNRRNFAAPQQQQ